MWTVDNFLKTRSITLRSGSEPWQPGDFSSDFIRKGRKLPFAIYRVYVRRPSLPGIYHLDIYYGDETLAQVAWQQLSLDDRNPILTLDISHTITLTGQRVRARLVHEKGAARVQIALGYLYWRGENVQTEKKEAKC